MSARQKMGANHCEQPDTTGQTLKREKFDYAHNHNYGEDVESTNQLADILTQGNFTRDEGNHLLHLFNIMSNTTCTCSHFFVPKRKHSVAMSKGGHKKISRRMTRPKSKRD